MTWSKPSSKAGTMTEAQHKQTPKTGLATRIREWASRRRKPFSLISLYKGLGLTPGKPRERARNAIPDFLARGEMERAGGGRYRYNPKWKPQGLPSPLKGRLIKACYVAGPVFKATDIMRWAEAPKRNYVQKLLKKLVQSGYVMKVGMRKVPQGRENLYRISDRARFRKDLM